MRICFDARSIRSQMTGIGVYSSCLLREMIASGAPHQWILPHLPPGPSPASPLDEFAGRPGVERHETKADYGDHPIGELWLNFSLPRLLARTNADLLHGPAYLIPWRGARARKIVTIFDLVCFRVPGAYTARFAWYMRQVIRLSARAADGIIAISECTARDLVELAGVPREKIRVIYLGAAPSLKPPSPPQIEAVRRRHRIEGPYLLYVGTIEPRKGIQRMISVLERLDRMNSSGPSSPLGPSSPSGPTDLTGHKLSLVLAGKIGWRAKALVEAIEASPLRSRILRLDYVPDGELAALYGGAEALLYLSDYEGFGLPPLEAMACGCPVIASNRASLPEVMGGAGVLLDPDDIRAATETIAAWLAHRDQRQAAIEKGLRQAARFTWSRAAEETLAYYEEITERRAVPNGAEK